VRIVAGPSEAVIFSACDWHTNGVVNKAQFRMFLAAERARRLDIPRSVASTINPASRSGNKPGSGTAGIACAGNAMAIRLPNTMINGSGSVVVLISDNSRMASSA
jgi:hypothetical protein